ncbi:Type 2 DNA topoisomerase 6 subunit B [Acidilobus saccharovorans 345-15]|uniref:Type 2 DNA topoisomerase 6 subunit B n=1 Tax=Acidilobus saccharovorans (strain DSM 16705 / JCM 18335 / VKM B-2471 / 345-15) TaxID=666510 RepID=D9PZY9_ACIS3|nr:DNA topoisomerase VI subunit B [Acidilobus saccharovorans]ADL18627.1 Type 2 DNA topoisomerase 6 subunit B [Acidilobus saccharovorans 345-15]
MAEENAIDNAKEKFSEISVAEFFSKNKELAGFSNPTRALYQTVRELVENALDATDSHGILPEVKIYIKEVEPENEERPARYEVSVEDNGIGVPKTVMAQAFGKVLFSSKYVIRQTRGMYGLGVKAVVLYSQTTTGRPITVVSSQEDSNFVYYQNIKIDIKKNEPMVVEDGQLDKRSSWHGTIASAIVEGDWTRAKPKIIEYVRRTAIIAPYAELWLVTPEGEIYFFPRATKKMPKPPREAKPHPHGVDLEQVRSMLMSTQAETLLDFLKEEFQGIGDKTATEFLRHVGLKPDINPKTLLKKEKLKDLEALVTALRNYRGFKGPRSDYLSPIGEELIELGLTRMFKPEWVKAVTRPARAYQGHPFIVEVGIAYGGAIQPQEEPILLRFANKIPLLYEEKEDVSYKVLTNIDWGRYGVQEPYQLAVLVHVASTKVPYKGVGKESISEIPELESEIRNGIHEVARSLRIYISRKAREELAKEKIVSIAKYIPEVARSLAILSSPPEDPNRYRELEPKVMELLISKVAASIEMPKIDGRQEDPRLIVERVIKGVSIQEVS